MDRTNDYISVGWTVLFHFADVVILGLGNERILYDPQNDVVIVRYTEHGDDITIHYDICVN